tara:strand:+ start:230 stop:586 length:357 start_codon:yes stop_codon:yes gene_type:complete
MNTKEFITCLFEIECNAHIAHLQTKSFAQHTALGELYEGISDLRDSYCENFQAIYGIIKGYPSTMKIIEGKDMVIYLKGEVKQFREYRKTIMESELQQMIDNVIEFVNKTIYKLTNLS